MGAPGHRCITIVISESGVVQGDLDDVALVPTRSYQTTDQSVRHLVDVALGQIFRDELAAGTASFGPKADIASAVCPAIDRLTDRGCLLSPGHAGEHQYTVVASGSNGGHGW